MPTSYEPVNVMPSTLGSVTSACPTATSASVARSAASTAGNQLICCNRRTSIGVVGPPTFAFVNFLEAHFPYHQVPDEFLARNVAANTDIKIIAWEGHCEVHEKFSGEDVRQIREAHPGAIVLAHPECPPDVLEEADFAGSTSALSSHVKESGARKVVLLTECSMSDNVAADNPGVEFVKPCNLCPHMKRISLENIYDTLVTMKHEVTVPEDVRVRAKAAIDAMLALGPPPRAPKFKVGAGVHVPVELI